MSQGKSLLVKLEFIRLRFIEVGEQITNPEVIADNKRFAKLNREYRELERVVEVYRTYKNTLDNISSSRQMLKEESDAEMREMAKAELDDLEAVIPEMEEQIKVLLLPADPQDPKNAVLEIRGGTGGDEAAIFAGDLLRMYTKYAERKGWKMEITNMTEGTAGAYKENVANVTGEEVYCILKYE